ncbi:MAG: ATP-binding cassette domain-containing protein, partial [Actinobacteria bacterium]|nr:ATP-binding cassette domain-containing protein [Actinomycetota bacterium]
EVLNGVSLEVPDRKLVALLGRNGMGKTSLCRSIMGLDPPAVRSGTVAYNGTDITDMAAFKIARLGLGYVPQGRRIFGSLDVEENLAMAQRAPAEGNEGEVWDLERVWELFPQLAERKKNTGSHLSGGEQQMVAIGRALTTNPGLLIMDEPSEGLAPVIVDQLNERLLALKETSLSILLVEQNYSMALKLADIVYVIENGKVVFTGGPDELDSNEDVKRRHLGVGV